VVREIGMKLHERGGVAVMLDTHERFVRLRPPEGARQMSGQAPSPGRILEHAWRGIGMWQA
jgi:hypothetical protein